MSTNIWKTFKILFFEVGSESSKAGRGKGERGKGEGGRGGKRF